MRIVSWNVNGLRAIAQKGFLDWLARDGADVLAVQETRARPEQLAPELRAPHGYVGYFAAAARPGYSGVAIFARQPADAVESCLGRAELDAEGRFLLARFGKLSVVSCYFPNGNGKNRDNSRVPYKLAFYRHLFDQLARACAHDGRVLVLGDYNTAQKPIDLARPRQNVATSGFLTCERDELARWLDSGWIDTFRHFQPAPGHYTWWSQRVGVRDRNIGWRIDYALASPGLRPYLRGAGIEASVRGSDHCPIYVSLDPSSQA